MWVRLRVGVVPSAAPYPPSAQLPFLEAAPAAATRADASSFAAVVLAWQVAGVVPVAGPVATPPLVVGRQKVPVLTPITEAGAAATARRASVRLDEALIQGPLVVATIARRLPSELRPA